MRRHGPLAAFIATLGVIATSAASAQGGSWLPYGTTGASDVAINPTGVVWLVGREPHSIRTTLVLGVTSFALPASRANPAQVAVDLHGFPWLVLTDGTVWHYSRSATGVESWSQQRSLNAIDIAVGANGAVWAVGKDQRVMRLNGDTWEPVSGGAGVKIAVDPAGNPWIVNASGQIWKYSGTSWSLVPGTASDITIAPDGTVFVLGPIRVAGGFEVLRLNGSTWERIVGGGATAIAAGTNSVFVAQDTTTNLVLSSINTRLTVDLGASSGATTLSVAPAGTPANGTVAGTSAGVAGAAVVGASIAASNGASTSSPSSSANRDTAHVSNGSATTAAPQSGSSAAGKIGGLLGGILSAGASAAAPIAGAAAEGAARGAVAGVIPSTIPIPVPAGGAGGLLSAGSSAAVTSASGAAAATPATSAASAASPSTSAPSASQPKLDLKSIAAMRPLPSPAVAGNLLCPIFSAGSRLAKSCSLVKQAAQMLAPAPSTDCAAPSFADPVNGGECWSCPAGFMRRDGGAVSAKDACWQAVTNSLSQKVDTQYSVASQTKGCSLLKAVIGFGTAFRSGGDCFACPLGLVRSISSMNARAVGSFAECVAGKSAGQIVYQLAQYPESGVYRFMPGLLQMALADPNAVDTFLLKRANGDLEVKKKLWAGMIADPAGSAELKALLFASLLTEAEKPDSSAIGAEAVKEFEKYVHDRQSYVGSEAARIYSKWQEVNALAQTAKHSGGVTGVASKALGAASAKYGALAWTGAIPDSAGAAFIVASAALSHLTTTSSVDSVMHAHVASFNVAYLNPVTSAFENGLAVFQNKDTSMLEKAVILSRLVDSAKALKRSEAALISTTLMNDAAGFRSELTSLVGRSKAIVDSTFTTDMGKVVSVKAMLDSQKPEQLQSLMLYWALATSPHKASDVVGTGSITGTELCSSNAWTLEQCTKAKDMVAAAAKAVGELPVVQ